MSKIVTVAILACSYLFAELAHWLPITTSKSLANAMKFGDVNETCVNASAACNSSTDCESDCYEGTGAEVQAIFAFYFVLPISVTTIIFGFLADFSFRVKILACALGVLSLSQLGIAFVSSYAYLAMLRILIGAAEGAFQPISGAIIANTFGAASSRGMAIFNWGIYLGFALSFGVAQLFENNETFGWKASYVLTGACGLLLVPAMLFLVKDQVSDVDEVKEEEVPALEERMEKLEKLSITQNLTAYFVHLKRPDILVMILAGIFRHTSGFTWGYNQALYMTEAHPDNENTKLYLMICPVIAGVSGATIGGMITDYLRKSPKFSGAKGALVVLTVCHLCGAPFIFLALYLPDPYCFIVLYIGYVLIEMWFGVYLMGIADLFDKNITGQAIGYTIFILRLVAGNLPTVVTILKTKWSYFYALVLMVPGFHIISAVLFAITFFLIKKPENQE